MSRFWFALSLGGNGSEAWLRSVITDVKETVAGEIWSVVVTSASSEGPRLDPYYVLDATCEVVGHPPEPVHPTCVSITTPQASNNLSQVPLRADWSTYIDTHVDGSLGSLLSHLKCANCEEYERGISQLWLRRVALEGEQGAAKRAVAERYVLACVVGNR